jgi:hypothetical protein
VHALDVDRCVGLEPPELAVPGFSKLAWIWGQVIDPDP